MPKTTVSVGDTFRSVIADCNALWRVDRVQGDVAYCHVVNEPWDHNGRTYDSDYAGKRDVFMVADVAARLAQAQAWQDRHDASLAFFDGLELGQDVHYDHGGGQWVRCEVIEFDPAVHPHNGLSKYGKGDKVLRPYALVGPSWRPRDLPGWFVRADGERIARYCYHAGVIERGEVWRPDYACVYESGKTDARKGDPTTMEPHSLDPEDNVMYEQEVTV